MPAPLTFRLHPDARLIDATGAVRAAERGVEGFTRIPATPSSAALPRLLAVLQQGDSFCVSDSALPDGTQAATGDFLTLTGGSSGQPRFVRRTQASWIAGFEVNAAAFRYAPDDSIAVLGALSHSLALHGVLEALHLGLGAHVLDALPPSQQRAHLGTRGVRILCATPTQLRLLAGAARPEPLAAVRLILCGGGTLDGATRAAARSLCPAAEIRTFYGAAETSFITLSDDATPEGSVGRAYPGVEIAVRDAAGKPTGGTGEIWVRSPYLFEGYAGPADGGAERDGPFVSVGEIGRIDTKGYLWLTGRKSRAVRIAEQTVHPEAVEDFLATLAGVRPAAVVAVPDPLRGHALVAVLEGARDDALAQRIAAACGARFGALLRPRRVLFVPALPRLPSGKTDLVALGPMVAEAVA